MNASIPDLLQDGSDSPSASRDAVRAIIRFARVLRSRSNFVLVALAIAGVIGAAYYLAAPRVYRANASLMVTQAGDVWKASMADGGRNNVIPTHEQLFSKNVVINGAIQRIKEMEAELRQDFAHLPEDQWGRAIRDRLRTGSSRNADILELSYRSSDPDAAKAILQAVVDSYIDFMDQYHQDVSLEIIVKLNDERIKVESELKERQEKLLETRNNIRVLGLNDSATASHPYVQRVVKLNDSLVETQQQRINLEASLKALRDAMRGGGDLQQHLLAMEPIVGREFVLSSLGLTPQLHESLGLVERSMIEEQARLRKFEPHLGAKHPVLIETRQKIAEAEQFMAQHQGRANQRIQQLHNDVLGPMIDGMLTEQLSLVRTKEQDLLVAYEQAEAEAMRMNNDVAELIVAEREWERFNSLHETLVDRITNIDIRQNHADVRVAVVSDPETQTSPVSPQLAVIGMLCAVGGLVVGVGVVYVLDQLDDRFRSPEEMSQQLAAPLLAIVRKFSAGAEQGVQSVIAFHQPETIEAEAFRTLRTTLAFAHPAVQRLAVTSSEPGDGKTTVICNLAATHGHVGKRTLLIDADMRRPGLTIRFDMRRQAGLSDVLQGHGDVEHLVCPTAMANVDLLPSGARPTNPLELLSGHRLEEIIAWAETRYDHVLIDCPPIMAASDAALIGRSTDGVLVVVQPGKNHRRVVMRAVEGLRTMNVNIVGIVANRIDEQQHEGYYGYGYGYGYGNGQAYGRPEAAEEPVSGGLDLESWIGRAKFGRAKQFRAAAIAENDVRLQPSAEVARVVESPITFRLEDDFEDDVSVAASVADVHMQAGSPAENRAVEDVESVDRVVARRSAGLATPRRRAA